LRDHVRRVVERAEEMPGSIVLLSIRCPGVGCAEFRRNQLMNQASPVEEPPDATPSVEGRLVRALKKQGVTPDPSALYLLSEAFFESEQLETPFTLDMAAAFVAKLRKAANAFLKKQEELDRKPRCVPPP